MSGMLSIPASKQRVEHNILPSGTYDRCIVVYICVYTTRPMATLQSPGKWYF
jgi:hypothetical protein